MGRTIQPIIEGVPSGAEHDAVVVLGVFRDGVRRGLCAATRVAPNLLLTARHCVSETDAQASCYTDGSAIAGAGLHGDYDPRELAVFVGENGVASSVSDPALATAYGVIDRYRGAMLGATKHPLVRAFLERAFADVVTAHDLRGLAVMLGRALDGAVAGVTSSFPPPPPMPAVRTGRA